jgi:hypothetical protein
MFEEFYPLGGAGGMSPGGVLRMYKKLRQTFSGAFQSFSTRTLPEAATVPTIKAPTDARLYV